MRIPIPPDERMRAAAARLRADAVASTSAGDWDAQYGDNGGVVSAYRTGRPVATTANPADARYIRTMHPPTALALADLLDSLSAVTARHPELTARTLHLCRTIMHETQPTDEQGRR